MICSSDRPHEVNIYQHPTDKRNRRALAASAVLLLGVVVPIAMPLDAANASSVDVVLPHSITLTNTTSATSNTVGDRMSLQFRYDTTGLDVDAGDTFTVTLPSSLDGFEGTFPLTDHETGATAADCVTVSMEGSAASNTTCTFTDYVDSHSGTKGSADFEAEAVAATTESTVVLHVGGSNVTVALPYGTSIRDEAGQGAPTAIAKYGRFEGAKQDEILWQISLPGAQLASQDRALVTDTLAPGTQFDQDDAYISVIRNADYDTGNAAYLTQGVDYTLTVKGQELSWNLTGPFDPANYYEIVVPVSLDDAAHVPAGTTFRNSAIVNGLTVSDSVTRSASGSGTGDGDGLGSLSVEKVLAGTARFDIPADLRYSVVATIREPGTSSPRTVTLSLTAGGDAASIHDLPGGTEVTLNETPPADRTDMKWEQPTFASPTPIETDAGESSVSIVVEPATLTRVTITNTATADLVAHTAAPGPVDAPKAHSGAPASDAPGTVAAAPAADDRRLAFTGSMNSAAQGLVGLALFLMGLLALLINRRRRNRVGPPKRP